MSVCEIKTVFQN